MALIKFSPPPRPRWRGFSFTLHLLRVQGFYFALLQCIHIQAFTASFAPSMPTYRTCRKTAHRALQRLFLRFAPFNRPQYQADTSSYNTVCDTLGRITAPHCLQRIPGYHHHAGRCTAQHSRPIIIMYIRARPCYGSMPDCAAYRRPCQPGGVSMLPTPGG